MLLDILFLRLHMYLYMLQFRVWLTRRNSLRTIAILKNHILKKKLPNCHGVDSFREHEVIIFFFFFRYTFRFFRYLSCRIRALWIIRSAPIERSIRRVVDARCELLSRQPERQVRLARFHEPRDGRSARIAEADHLRQTIANDLLLIHYAYSLRVRMTRANEIIDDNDSLKYH